MSDPTTEAARYVEEHREELMAALLHGDETLRALAIAVLYEAGDEIDVEEVKRELELYGKVSDDLREQLG